MIQLNAVAQAQGNAEKANLTNLVADGAKVVGIDYLEPLVTLSEKNIRKKDDEVLTSGLATVFAGDGWKGASDHAGPTGYHIIHVGAG